MIIKTTALAPCGAAALWETTDDMSNLKWNIPCESATVPPEFLRRGFSPLLAAVLRRRGLTAPDEALRFIGCGEEELGDPLMMTDMPQAVRRLTGAIASGERVAVYGDYDVDGITSSCLLTSYLRSRGLESCELYIPDRLEEGYGVNAGAIRALHERGVSLIVTVDCGVTAVEEAALASSLGMDMIITDHHECREVLPDVLAVVDPKRPDCSYPHRDLAGVGVAFKLLCAMEGSSDRILDSYADLIALGTIADVMPLTGENRFIVKRGLSKLHEAPCPGLRALLEQSGLGGKRVTAASLGFSLAPRLNASGRLGQVDAAVRLLMTDDPREAEHSAEMLCSLNRERQLLEQDIWTDAVKMLGDEKPDGPIVLAGESWHQGVIGIVASRLTEAYHVPAVMICLDGEHGKGSCRSYGGFNLFEALSACAEHLDGFGGHALAAGLTISRESIDAFRAALRDYYVLHPAQSEPALDIDLCIDSPKLLEMRCVEDLDRLEPCGSGNPGVTVCMLGAVLESITAIGGGRHTRLRLGKFGQDYDAVLFSHSPEELGLHPGDYVDAAFTPQINEFRSRRTVQLLMSDVRAHDFSAARAMLRGGTALRSEMRPQRQDFARIWRSLAHLGGEMCASLRTAAEALAPGMPDEMLCLCLKVFEEMGLIRLNFDGRELKISQNRSAEKVDLSASGILRGLDAQGLEAGEN